MEHEPALAPVVASAPTRVRWRRYWVRYPLSDPALAHRSQVFSAILNKLGYSKVAGAISSADLPFLGGAPRNPNLKPGQGRDYSTVRYAEQEYAYTQVVVTRHLCIRCGRSSMEKHSLELRHPHQSSVTIGHVRACPRCDRDHWLFKSNMSKAVAMRLMKARSVP